MVNNMENLNKDSSMKEYKHIYDKRLDNDIEEISRIITMAQEQKRMLLHMRLGKPEEPNTPKEIETKPEDTWILKKSTGREEYYGAKYFKLTRREGLEGEESVESEGGVKPTTLNKTDSKLPEPEISVTQKILDAIDEYFANKTVGYIKDDKSNDTQTILKVFDPQTNSTAIVRITSMDWL